MHVKRVFTATWFLILLLLFPAFGGLIEKNVKLKGVTEKTELQPLTVQGLMDGSSQQNIGDWLQENIPSRKILIKIRNQFMYSVLKTSPNHNVVIGKSNYLYEPEYILRYLGITPPLSIEELQVKVDAIVQLDKLCESAGKKLYIFITPSKARFCSDQIPERYYWVVKDSDIPRGGDYNNFIQLVAKTDLKVFDSVRFIQENRDLSDTPLFYSSGIHWNPVWGELAAAELAKYIGETSGYDLGTISISSKPTNKIIHPNADLYQSLNLFTTPNCQYYRAIPEKETEGKDKPLVFNRGGSFMGQSLGVLLKMEVWGDVYSFENNYIIHNDEVKRLSSRKAYDKLDEETLDALKNADILILEINEHVIRNAGFGFIEYLNENPGLISRS